MRKEIVLACSILAAAPLGAATVEVAAPRVVMLSSKALRGLCPTGIDTACTVFRKPELVCSCELRRGAWTPSVTITSQPLTFASHDRFLVHEMSHIADFKASMTHHAEELERQSFASEAACDEFVDRAYAQFGSVLHEYLRYSTLLRDHRLLDRK